MSGRGRGDQGPSRGQPRGRGGGRGRGGQGQGQRPAHGSSEKDIKLLKANLQHTIKNAATLLNELGLDKGTPQKKPPGKTTKDTRGSKSLMDLSSGSGGKNSRGGSPSKPQGHPRGRGGGGQGEGRGRGGGERRGQGRGETRGRGESRGRGGYRGSPANYRGHFNGHPPFPMPGGNIHPGPYPLMQGPPNPNYYPQAPPLHPGAHTNSPGNMPPPYYDQYGIPPPQHCPPPSYEDSVEDLQTHHLPEKSEDLTKKKSSKPKLTTDVLVKTLVKFRGQFENVDTICRQLDRDPSEVVGFAKTKKDFFAIMGNGRDAMMEFVPNVSLCSDYFTEESCNSRGNCKNLHICKTYVTGFCNSGASCQYGHRWDTNHNKEILSKFHLDIIDRKTLHDIIKKLSKNNFKLEICRYYNSERGCKYDACRRLHICSKYVVGAGKCLEKNCSLNHNIVLKQCSDVLKANGIAMNESPRDILLHVLSTMDSRLDAESSQSKGAESKTEAAVKSGKRGKKDTAPSLASSSSDESDSELSNDEKDQPQRKDKKKNGQKNRKQKSKVKTYYSTDLIGDVFIPEICVFSIDGSCMNEKKGCKYLHAKSLFHWQVEKDGKWYNLRIFQSKKLENAYRDIPTSTVDVPALDPSRVEDFAKDMLEILGTTSWKADLQTMNMTNNELSLRIRRVSTQSSVVFSHPKATVFEWYFKDDNGKWVQFEQVGSVGNQQLVCNISCEDIEKQYLSDPSSVMLIRDGDSQYRLDLSKMTHVEVKTSKEREIRRRPARLSYQKKSVPEEDPSSALPKHWSQMNVNQTHLLVSLETDSAEYLEVSGRLRLTLPTAYITSIKRLQNPYLWRLLQFKKATLLRRYDENQLNLQKLFHGISPQEIDTICKENIDWRQGSIGKQDYGQGTYFSNSAAISRKECIADEFGRVSMFLTQVIIGTVVKGDSSMTRPPANPSTGALYDTTVDDVEAPTVFAKYDKEEYYPDYVIEFY